MTIAANIIWRSFEKPSDAFQALVSDVSQALVSAKKKNGRAHLVLSGGNTPKQYLPILANTLDDWHGIMVSLSDERWVPASHVDSNEAMVRTYFLSSARGASFVGMMGQGDTPKSDAQNASNEYDKLSWPADVMILGAAPDGHVASLFPGKMSQHGEGHKDRVIATTNTAGEARLSLSGKALLSTHQILIVTSGKDKRDTLRKSQTQGPVDELPARLLLNQDIVPVTVVDYD